MPWSRGEPGSRDDPRELPPATAASEPSSSSSKRPLCPPTLVLGGWRKDGPVALLLAEPAALLAEPAAYGDPDGMELKPPLEPPPM
mmetsp:Transcript_74325/g.229668  ORF Transcript_74325/g.229668 Transcript_74325/m.229668 type:complete len:86 (-) Transcript_74325:7-264(-)